MQAMFIGLPDLLLLFHFFNLPLENLLAGRLLAQTLHVANVLVAVFEDLCVGPERGC